MEGTFLAQSFSELLNSLRISNRHTRHIIQPHRNTETQKLNICNHILFFLTQDIIFLLGEEQSQYLKRGEITKPRSPTYSRVSRVHCPGVFWLVSVKPTLAGGLNATILWKTTGLVWLSLVGLSLVWFGLVWLSLVWFGLVGCRL